jgi:hypothetical protein
MAIPILGRLVFALGWIGSCESAAVFMARGVLARILLALSSGLPGRSRARRRRALHQIILLPSEILAGPGCCFRIADRDRDPVRNLLGQLDIVVANNLGAPGVGVERADGCAWNGSGTESELRLLSPLVMHIGLLGLRMMTTASVCARCAHTGRRHGNPARPHSSTVA